MGDVTGLFNLTDNDIFVMMELAYEKMIALRNRKGHLSSHDLKIFDGCSSLILSLCKQGRDRGMTLKDISERAAKHEPRI
ncbi:hypothetical protein LCGC14_0763370 [marine sediment metagenome]|uniref:Uncharacterized protein n=1 Tax=marine sediment metagenome TaxID=412755 RepID=A0A0F9Q4J6_9ZZZZ